jgi:hypothetical protein
VAANPARSTVRVTLPDNVEAGRGGWPNYDASRDGTRWLVVTAAAERTIQPLVVLLGWTPGAR